MSLNWDGSQLTPVTEGCMHLTRADLESLVVEQGRDPELSAIQVHLQECAACQIELVAKLHEEEAAGNRQVSSWARIKILNPITSIGPSAMVYLLTASPRSLHVRVPRVVWVGARVHVLSPLVQGFGTVRYSIPAGREFQIGVRLEAAG